MKLELGNRAYCTTSPTIHVRLPKILLPSGCQSDSFQVKDHSQHTIGVEFSSRTVKLGEKRIKLQVSLCSDGSLCSCAECVIRCCSYGIQRVKSASGSHSFATCIMPDGITCFIDLLHGVIIAVRQELFLSMI